MLRHLNKYEIVFKLLFAPFQSIPKIIVLLSSKCFHNSWSILLLTRRFLTNCFIITALDEAIDFHSAEQRTISSYTSIKSDFLPRIFVGFLSVKHCSLIFRAFLDVSHPFSQLKYHKSRVNTVVFHREFRVICTLIWLVWYPVSQNKILKMWYVGKKHCDSE